MSIQTLKDRLPDYAKDLILNLSTLAAETLLADRQKAGTFIAAALASRNPEVIRAINDEFAGDLDPAAYTAVKAAAAIMGMNNVYYRLEKIQAAVRIASVVHLFTYITSSPSSPSSSASRAPIWPGR